MLILKTAIDQYLLNSSITKSDKTYIWEEKTFRSFYRFCQDEHICDLNEISRNLILQFINFERKRGLSAITINKKIDLIKRMTNFHDCTNDSLKIKKMRIPKKVVDRLSDNELSQLLRYLDNLDETNGNNAVYKILFKFILDSGVRIDEALNIKKVNVNTKHKVILLEHAKFMKERFVDYSDFTSKYIDEMLSLHDGEFLFWNIRLNRKLNYDSDVQYFYRKISKELNTKRFTAHKLRHTFASISAQNGMNILSLKEILGHDHIRTTQINMHADRSKTKDDYKKYSPFSSK